MTWAVAGFRVDGDIVITRMGVTWDLSVCVLAASSCIYDGLPSAKQRTLEHVPLTDQATEQQQAELF